MNSHLPEIPRQIIHKLSLVHLDSHLKPTDIGIYADLMQEATILVKIFFSMLTVLTTLTVSTVSTII